MKSQYIALLFIVVFSCQRSKHTLSQQLIGTWENVSLEVKMNTINNTDSSGTLIVTPGNWEAILNIKPIKTTYRPDGTFTSQYFDLAGKAVGVEEGKWLVRNDSLILSSTGYQNTYKVTFEADKGRFVSRLDWDQDGLRDDHYDGWQKKID